MMTIVVCGSCNYLAFGMVTVMLPHLIKDKLGAGNFAVGVIVGVFAVSGVLTRPAAGRLGNRYGRRSVMITGALVIGASFGLYGVVPAIALLVVLRLSTGVGEALFYTGAATMVADHAPPDRRSQAIGYYSVAIYLGTGLGPTLGESLQQAIGFTQTFAVAGLLSLASGLLAIPLPNLRIDETSGERPPLLNRDALLPGSVLALGVMGLVAFDAYVPLYATDLGMSGAQYVFLTYSAVMIGIRAFGGRVHHMDPRRAATLAMTMMAGGLLVMSSVASRATLYVGAAMFASGFAVQFPALMTMAVNRATDRERASAVGTYTAFMNLSLGTGGFLLAIPAAAFGYRASFAFGSVSAVFGVVLLRVAVQRRVAPALLVAEDLA